MFMFPTVWNPLGESRGVGFIHFDRSQEARAAIETLNGSKPFGGETMLTVRCANNSTPNHASLADAMQVNAFFFAISHIYIKFTVKSQNVVWFIFI